MRVVFDTNIFIAAALRGGFSENIIALAERGIVSLVSSDDILDELKQKLISKKLYLGLFLNTLKAAKNNLPT